MDQDEDAVAHAGAKALQWVALAATAAEALAQITAQRAQVRAERDGEAVASARAELHARYGRDRLAWAPMLDPKTRDAAGLADTGRAWAAAQGWRGDPEADHAATLATDRLRTLRPDEMRLYDRAVAEGADPVQAMRDVAPLMDRQRARHGEAGPGRPRLVNSDVTGADLIPATAAAVAVAPTAPVVLTGEWSHPTAATTPTGASAVPTVQVLDAQTGALHSESVEAVGGYFPAPVEAMTAAGAARVTSAEPAALVQTGQQATRALSR